MLFIAFKAWITINDRAKLLKKNICLRFYIADKKLCEYEELFGEKSKKRGKLIKYGSPGQHTENKDSHG